MWSDGDLGESSVVEAMGRELTKGGHSQQCLALQGGPVRSRLDQT